MADRAHVRCQTPGCAGVLGALAAGCFIPAGHVIGGRDLYAERDGEMRVRCTWCGVWYRVRANGRLHLMPVVTVA